MKKAVILVETGFDDVEYIVPYYRFLEAGFEVTVAAPSQGTYSGKVGLKVEAIEIKSVNPTDVDLVFIPGGHAPDRLRRYPEVIEFVRKAYDNGAVIGAICHAPHVLISAGLTRGRRLTSFFSIRDDVINSGAEWVDAPIVVDERIVTARFPNDLPIFLPELIKIVNAGLEGI